MNKLIKYILIIILIVFACSYIISTTGYYEYNLQNKKILTTKSIEQFEQDVKDGKKINIKDYTKENEIDYSNKLTNNTTKLSIKINKLMRTNMKNIFNHISKIVNE